MEHVKHPRTPHLPWSPGRSADDESVSDVSHFEGKVVVVTEKLDGECTSLYRDGVHARSASSGHHPSRSWVKALWQRVQSDVSLYGRIVGENLFAVHSIHYEELPDYFLAFMMFNNDGSRDTCLSWADTGEQLEALGLASVPVLYHGVWDEARVKDCCSMWSKFGGVQEGYVVRVEDEFDVMNFGRSVAKYVRANHVQTDEHWMNKPVVKNGLKKREG